MSQLEDRDKTDVERLTKELEKREKRIAEAEARAAELEAKHTAEQLDQQRLRDAGHAFNERMAAAEYGDEGLVDQLGLSGDYLADFRAAMCQQLCGGGNGRLGIMRCGAG